MKRIFEQGFGGDGQSAGLYIDDEGNLALEVKYPMAKLLSPVNDAIDAGFAKLEAAIPGSVDDAILEPIKAGLKAEIATLLAGK